MRAPLLLMLGALILLLTFEVTELDLMVAGAFWDGETGVFPMRGHPVLAPLLYRGAKAAMYGLGVIAFLILCVAWRKAPDRGARRAYAVAALTLVMTPLLVVIVKHASNRYCPWSLQPFGGDVPYVTLLQALPAAWQRGQCFPAGHASGGLVWVGVGIALWHNEPRLSRAILGFGLVTGMAMGLFRMAEGAHFLSHTLWALWLACLVPVALKGILSIATGR